MTPTDEFIVPIFDKQVTLFTRSGQQVLLGVSNDPVHLNDLDMDVDIDSKNVHTDGFDDHVVSSVHLNYWAGVPLPFQSTQQSQGNRIAACNVVVGFRRWDSYADQQTEWRWCSKCNTMFFAGSGAVSVCPSGGAHDSSHSLAYVLFQGGQPPESEIVWNWCLKCGCIYGPDGGWACAAGGGHNGTQSGRYAMLLKVADPAAGMPVPRTTTTQDGWHMCSKCSLLFNLAGQSKSCCPADKGQHTESGHPEYAVKYF
jgi:hypothetical protein